MGKVESGDFHVTSGLSLLFLEKKCWHLKGHRMEELKDKKGNIIIFIATHIIILLLLLLLIFLQIILNFYWPFCLYLNLGDTIFHFHLIICFHSAVISFYQPKLFLFYFFNILFYIKMVPTQTRYVSSSVLASRF